MPDHRPNPKLRWHTEMVTRQPIFVVPGESTGSSSVRPMGATWGIRERGDSPALRARLGVEPRRVPREYACPVHGRFTRDETEDVEEVACSVERCGLTSPWAGSSCAIGIEPGMVTG